MKKSKKKTLSIKNKLVSSSMAEQILAHCHKEPDNNLSAPKLIGKAINTTTSIQIEAWLVRLPPIDNPIILILKNGFKNMKNYYTIWSLIHGERAKDYESLLKDFKYYCQQDNATITMDLLNIYEKTNDSLEKVDKCLLCGKNIVLKEGKYGPFYGCSGFPQCQALYNMKRLPNKKTQALLAANTKKEEQSLKKESFEIEFGDLKNMLED